MKDDDSPKVDLTRRNVIDGSVKEDDYDDSGRMITCPYCGTKSVPSIVGDFVFCLACHRKMPWVLNRHGDIPVKEDRP